MERKPLIAFYCFPIQQMQVWKIFKTLLPNINFLLQIRILHLNQIIFQYSNYFDGRQHYVMYIHPHLFITSILNMKYLLTPNKMNLLFEIVLYSLCPNSLLTITWLIYCRHYPINQSSLTRGYQ